MRNSLPEGGIQPTKKIKVKPPLFLCVVIADISNFLSVAYLNGRKDFQ